MIAEADIRRVQEWMGHADVQTTMRYLHYAPRADDAALVAEAFRLAVVGFTGGRRSRRMTAPARSRVDRAGKRLRDHQRAMAPLSDAELTAELAVVEAFRAAHIKPLTLVAGDLRRHVADASQGEPRVGERLKRMDTILDKLERQATMALSRMHDIAGCRAIVSDQAIADALIDRLRAQRD
jgi:hypothetical protein